MSTRRWTCLTLCALIGTLSLISALVIFIDPFQIYRPATLYMPPLDRRTQVYSNAGVARHYDYDSAVVGTSVCDNFAPTQLDALFGGRFIKLVSDAGTLRNHAILLDLAYRTHDLKTVLYGMDVYSLTARLDKTGTDMPLYLYDENPLNDVAYWLNRSVLGSFLPRCFSAWGMKQDDSVRDRMFSWADEDDTYGTAALYNAVFTPPVSVRPADAFVNPANENLDAHLIPFVKDHPHTHFILFFPPYSAAEWSTMASRGTLDALLALRGLCYDRLSDFENVTLYDFAAREEWVTDLDNYKDTLHYGEWINAQIADCIAASDGLVTSRAQLDAATAQLREWADALILAGGWIF